MFYRNAIVAVLIGVSLSACSADPTPPPVATPVTTTTPGDGQDFMRQYLEDLARKASAPARPQPTTLEELIALPPQ